MSYLRLFLKHNRLLITQTSSLVSRRNNGFIVLVPEIGDEVNPLIGQQDLPEFNNFTIEKCISAIGNQGLAVEKSLKALEEEITTKTEINEIFPEVLNPLEEITSPLEMTWGLAKTLYLGNSSLMPTKSYLTIHDRASRVRASKFNSLPIFYAIKKSYFDTSKTLEEQEKRLMEKYLLEAKLNGIDIEGSDKYKLGDSLKKLSDNRTKFHNNVETARRSFQQNCNDPNVVKELPITLLQAMSADTKNPTKGPWKLSLQPHVVKSFLEHCPDHNLRWNLWQADVRKCSKHTEKILDNSVPLEEIRYARREQAVILGYKNYMEMSMETKMAGSVENVRKTLAQLHESARPVQDTEIVGLQEFAEKVGFHKALEVQDVPYYRRRQLMDMLEFNEEVISEYFPLNKIFDNLLTLAENLFNLKIVEQQGVNRWHEDVRFYNVFDLNEGGKSPVGGFYVDLYARDEEKTVQLVNSGWMVNIRSRSEIINSSPLSAIIFNFKQMPNKSVLLRIEDIHQLFSKFGQTLQNLLTKSRYSELAGTSNIEWDAVNIVGNVMSNLLYNEKILKSVTAHYSNNDPLPDKFVTAFMQERTHLAGFNLCRQLYFSELDMELHSRKDFWLDIVKELYPKYHYFELDKKDCHPCSFTPIFSGEWGGAYYSDVWSDLVAADVYSAFWEAGQSANEDDFKEVGKRFRSTFLTYGGTLNTNEVFRRFRGRDPSPKALLNSLGLRKKDVKK